MFHRIFGTDKKAVADTTQAAFSSAEAATGDTATVRRIVAKLEAMPPERARLVASAAYTLARAANADLDISTDEMAIIEHELQERAGLDEATAVLIGEMAKFQANTVGGTEDYVVTREFAALATEEQKVAMLHACFVISAADGTISAEESSEVNEIAKELDIPAEVLNQVRAEFHERLSSVQEVRRIAGQG